MHFTLTQLDDAYRWLCQQRKHFPPDADIWSFRYRYSAIKSGLLQEINSGEYQFSPQQKIIKPDGQVIHLWGSQDTLVMKMMAGVLGSILPLSPRCAHVKGHGGLKQSIVDVQRHLQGYHYVCKTDVQSFYESIDQYLLMEMINDSVRDDTLRYYLYQVIHRCVEFGGEFRDIGKGISRGCPISPILGALYLGALDDHFAGKDVYYIRYMDDILILSKTRWQNRKVVKQINHYFNWVKLEKHPDKTFIGKIEKGFDFLGYHFSKQPLEIARKTIQKHVLRIVQLYEQLRKKKATSDETASSLGLYVTRWQRWAVAGLQCITIDGLSSDSGFTFTEPDQSNQGRAE
jgi:RNA-directed DNA polymerase